MFTNPSAPAELVASIHSPWRATVAECLQRWRALDPPARTASYLVIHGEGGLRRTLNTAGIADLASRLG